MAVIKIRNTAQVIEGEQQVGAFLAQQGVLYEHWATDKLPQDLKDNCRISDEQKEQILQVFDAEIRDLGQRRGYVKWDVVALSDATPNLDELLKKFEQVHIHTEDEVRAITAGHGIFIIKGAADMGYFDVELEAGDVISVPENTPHFFTLMDDHEVVAIRLFIDPSGWVAHSYADPTFQK